MFFRFFFSRKTLKINPNNIKIEKKSQMSPKSLAPKVGVLVFQKMSLFLALDTFHALLSVKSFITLRPDYRLSFLVYFTGSTKRER